MRVTTRTGDASSLRTGDASSPIVVHGTSMMPEAGEAPAVRVAEAATLQDSHDPEQPRSRTATTLHPAALRKATRRPSQGDLHVRDDFTLDVMSALDLCNPPPDARTLGRGGGGQRIDTRHRDIK